MEAAERCPRCKKRRLTTVVVYGGGRSAVCVCGYTRIIERVDPDDLEREHWQWKEGLSATALKFRAIEALLQSIYEAKVCSTCAQEAPMEELRAHAMELEHLRSYLAQGEVYTNQKMDAYLLQVIDQLQDVGQLCEPCWQRVLQTTMRRFSGQY